MSAQWTKEQKVEKWRKEKFSFHSPTLKFIYLYIHIRFVLTNVLLTSSTGLGRFLPYNNNNNNN